jgi:hypothetical protein
VGIPDRDDGAVLERLGSFTTIRHAVMRLGPEPAAVEADFPQLGVNSTEFGETSFGGG